MHALFAYFVDNFDPFLFRIWNNVGPRWYGLAYVTAFGAGWLMMRLLARRGYADVNESQAGDFITWASLFGVLFGGRIGYALFYKPEMFQEPLSLLRVWEGGMASHGGMIGLILFTLYYARRYKTSWTNLGDNLVVAAPIGLFLGRMANFINGELYGRATQVSWAMQFPKEILDDRALESRALDLCGKIDPEMTSADAIIQGARHNPHIVDALRSVLSPRHPSQLYEAALEGVVLFAIMWFARTRTRQPNGVLTGIFFICYSVFRIIAEIFREPDAPLVGIFTRGQFLSFFLLAAGIGFILAAKWRPVYPKKLEAH